MAEYIEREAVLQKKTRMTEYDEGGWGANISVVRIEDINAIPAADVVEVVHGKWADHMVRDWRCSECGDKIHKVRQVDGYCYDDLPNYCPNCGAKMDGE